MPGTHTKPPQLRHVARFPTTIRIASRTLGRAIRTSNSDKSRKYNCHTIVICMIIVAAPDVNDSEGKFPTIFWVFEAYSARIRQKAWEAGR